MEILCCYVFSLYADVSIDTFSLPATSLPFPAVTICRRGRQDAAEYFRAVFNNFDPTDELLREHYSTYLETGHTVLGSIYRNQG